MASQWLILLSIISVIRLGAASPIFSLNEHNAPSFDMQDTNDEYYQNPFFGLSIEKPKGWYSMTSEKLRFLFQKIAIPVASNNNDLAGQILKTAAESLIPLFGFMEYPFGTENGKFNPTIYGIVTNITGQQINIENDCDTYINSNKLIQGSQMKIISNSDCHEVDINGKKFAMQGLTLNVLNISIINQIQYVRSTSNGYFFTFTLSFDNDVGKNQLLNIMDTLKFSQ